VTGGSDGIGLAYCKELVKQGFNICIIGRNEEKMQLRVDEIIAEVGQKAKDAKFKTIKADFGKLGKIEDYDYIAQELKGIDIGMLILNAGFADAYFADKIP